MRLIDSDFFEEKIKESIKWVDRELEKDRFSEGCKASLKDIMSTLRSYTPTIDAVPVVHGHWELAIGYDINRKVKCSECNRMNFEPSNFCPNCGAKMDDAIS